MSPPRDSGARSSSLSVQIVGASVEARAMEILLQSQLGVSVVESAGQVTLILGRDGLAALQRRRLRTPRRSKEVFVLLTNGREIDFRLARELPIRGLIGADESLPTFLQGLRDVAEGKSFCSPQMVPILISATSGAGVDRDPIISAAASRDRTAVEVRRLPERPAGPKPTSAVEPPRPLPVSRPAIAEVERESLSPDALREAMRLGLSNREAEIAVATCGGLSNQQIAEQFSVSLSTVKFHLYRIYQKLGINSRTQLQQVTGRSEVLVGV